jgi:hypothetical protein
VGTAGGPNVGALAFLNALVFFNMIASGIILLASVVCMVILTLRPVRASAIRAAFQVVFYPSCLTTLVNGVAAIASSVRFARPSDGVILESLWFTAFFSSPAIIMAGLVTALSAWRIAYSVPVARLRLWPIEGAAGGALLLAFYAIAPVAFMTLAPLCW